MQVTPKLTVWRRSQQGSAPEGGGRELRPGGREQLVSVTRPAARRTNIAAAQGVLRSVDAEERIAWVSKALCRTTDPDELFVRGAAQRKAAVICRHCPVMQECGADALDNKVEFGVWGGMTERQRRALLKQHPEVVSWSDFFDKRRSRGVG
jgi:WhiB family transcriptional regulator, redox-sensing transcriptional regulator